MKSNKFNKLYLVLILASLAFIPKCMLASELNATENKADPAYPVDHEYSFEEVVHQSMFGDVYSHPENWQELSISNFFSKGWDKPWVSPPTGGGGAPRQGWLNAFEGVFYRLSLGIFGWKHHTNNTDSYTGSLETFTPVNSRLNVKTVIPFSSNSDATNIGDIRVQARFMLSESRNFTQTFNIEFRTPTGSAENGDDVAAIIPQYQFWANWWKGLVVRGGTGFTVPYAGEISRAGARSTFNANAAIGYYMTPHDMTPFGDMVWYLATHVNQAIDNRAEGGDTSVTLSPGFRTHLGMDWYMLGTVEVPVTRSDYDYQVLFSFMKVY